MDKKEFGRFIAQCRKEQNMTQAQLAEILHVTDKAVSRWENGHGYPDVNMMQPLADALHVSLAELMNARKNESELMEEETINETVNNTMSFMEEKNHEKNNRKIRKYGVITLVLIFVISAVWAQGVDKPRRDFANMTLTYEGFEGGSIDNWSFYPGIQNLESCEFLPNENLHNGDTVIFSCTMRNSDKTMEKQIVLEDLLYMDDDKFYESKLDFLEINDFPEEILLRITEDRGYQVLIYVKETSRTYVSYEYDNLYFRNGTLCQVIYDAYGEYSVEPYPSEETEYRTNISDLEADIEQHLLDGWQKR